MEFGLQPRDRRQARREHRSGSPLSNMVASRAACLNRVQGAAHRDCWAHFDNREGQAGMDLCIYCDVGFGFRFSPPIWGVVDPRGGVAKWLAAKAFPLDGNRLREIQKSVNTTLADSRLNPAQCDRDARAQGRFHRVMTHLLGLSLPS